MKCTKTVILLVFLFCNVSELFACWSVLEDDPRPREPMKLYQVFTKEQWKASNFAKEEDLQWFRNAKFGMFIHFGLSTYKQQDLSWGICKVRKFPDLGSGPYPASVWTKWPEEFKLPEFDAAKIVEYAKDAGMKYIVVIAKHHDGFHMWDTEFSDFKITNTPFGRDFVKEIADACHKAGMKFGIYYSQRDWYHPDYCPVDPEKVIALKRPWTLKPGETSPMGPSHKKYIEYQYNVCRELCTKYGKLDVFWFDAVWWGGMFTAEMWDSENLSRMIRKLQPGIIINNRASIPGDFDTPEQHIGMFQNHRPWESCMCLCESWSYSNTPTKSPQQIIRMLVQTLTGDGNMLLSWGPQWSGEFHPDQVKALKQAGVWVKKNAKAIYGTRGGPWKPGKWGGSVYKDKTVYLHILSLTEKDKLVFSGLKQKVLKAKIHGGVDVKFNQMPDKLEIILPAEVLDEVDTIVELILDAHALQTDPNRTCGYVGLRPLPRYEADLKSNHGGPWAGLPTFAEQKGNYPFVAEHLDIVKGWLDGDFKTKRLFFEHYWGLNKARDDLDPKKNLLVKVIRQWESRGGVVEHILICREYRLSIHRGHPDAKPGPFKEDTRILSAKDVDDIRGLFRNGHQQGLLKHDNYKLIQMVEEPSFFAEDPRAQAIIEKMEGVAYEAHQFNRHWPLETGWSKPQKVIRGAKWTLDQGKEYIFYYGPVIWKSEQYYEFIERDWLCKYWKAGLPKHHPRVHYYLNTFPHEHGRGRPVGPESDPHSVLGFTKWLIQEIKMDPQQTREANKAIDSDKK